MPKVLLQEVANYCWSNNFLSKFVVGALCESHMRPLTCSPLPFTAVFTNFFKEYAEDFIDAPPYMEGGEHNLRHYALFQKYLQVYEVLSTLYNMQFVSESWLFTYSNIIGYTH